MIAGTDRIEKRQRLDVAAGQDVLPVVDEFAGLTVCEGCRAATKTGPGLEHQDAAACAGQPHGGAQPRTASPDHENLGLVQWPGH